MSGKHPIIANGEYYAEPIFKKNFGGEPFLPHEYIESKARLYSDLEMIQRQIEESDEVFLDEKIVCVRLEPKFEAKSYTPNSLLTESHMRFVGGRKYNNSEEKAKLYFMRTTDAELGNLKDKFASSVKDNVKAWRNQLCTINSIDLLKPEEKVMGFDEEWQSGKVEIIIHPLGNANEKVINAFWNLTGLTSENTAVRVYEDGLTFVCANIDKSILEKVKRFNPLRSVKPIYDDMEDPFRMSPISAKGPKLPREIQKSDIKVGVFDGGVQDKTYLVDPFCVNYDMVTAPADEKGLEHGTAVCSAVLYGDLFGRTELDTVALPAVNVESFRVLPMAKTGNSEQDYQMYETIDIIENVVTSRSDIKIFNLSLGPKGAIIDDELSRFTYVCDKLTYEVDEDEINPLFCVAVGNGGGLVEPMNRIQAPSDMVNGLSVGAYTYNAINDKIRAPYSCVGPGREGAKTKPDVLEFGGSTFRPFIAAMHGTDLIGVEQGTSFAAPVVAGKVGRLFASSELIVPHLGRALIIHNAETTDGDNREEYGFGFCVDDVNEMLECSDKKVTILYSGEMMSSSSVRLPIFLPEVWKSRGNVNIKWTICTVVNPNANDPDAYTNNCIEDTFYPHEMTFNFSKQGFSTKKLNLLVKENIAEATILLDSGYSKSELPVSKPAKKYYREEDLRNVDFKWDTIIKKNISMRTSSLMNPFLSLHAIGRDEYEHEKIRYYVVVTVDVPNYQGSLYDNIIAKYNNLVPIEIRNEERIQTRI